VRSYVRLNDRGNADNGVSRNVLAEGFSTGSQNLMINEIILESITYRFALKQSFYGVESFMAYKTLSNSFLMCERGYEDGNW
jgi:hypothetical protein